MFILDACASSGILKIIAFLKIILNFIFIIVPIGLIIIVSIDFAKAVISGDSDAQRESTKLGFNRILYAVLLFAVPYLVSLFITIIGNVGFDYARCLELAGDPKAIAVLERQEEAKKEAKLKAEEQARQIIAEKYQKEVAAQSKVKVNTVTVNAEGCDGVIYYENGNFYKPNEALVPKNGITKTKGSAPYGYNKYFYDYLTKFTEAAKKEGLSINPSTTEYGAWRSFEKQQYFYNCMISKKCNNGNLAATPGKSNHGWAIASDLSFGNKKAKYWAHDHANEYNLKFPLCNNVRTGDCVEDWHIEPLSIKEDNGRAKECM